MRCAVQVGVAVYLVRWMRASRFGLFQHPNPHVLMLKHHDDGLWRVPGGGREPLEDIELAARRECLEEVGIDLREKKLKMFHHDFTNHEQYGEWLTFHFITEVKGDCGARLVEPGVHSELLWMPSEHALNQMHAEIFAPTLTGLKAYKGYLER